MRFICKTLFDITATGVTGHYKPARGSFYDRAKNRIDDEGSWNRSRNQQRNYETLMQLVSMRAQITQSTDPVRERGEWSFEFEVETPYAFGPEENPTEMLLSDSAGVPMLVGLGNNKNLTPFLVVTGNEQNIWFDILQ